MGRSESDIRTWVFAEKVQDRGGARASCGLCGQRNLRYVFLVRNPNSGCRMWVGSSCILKFGLTVLDGQTPLSPMQARTKLRHMIRALRG